MSKIESQLKQLCLHGISASWQALQDAKNYHAYVPKHKGVFCNIQKLFLKTKMLGIEETVYNHFKRISKTTLLTCSTLSNRFLNKANILCSFIKTCDGIFSIAKKN